MDPAAATLSLQPPSRPGLRNVIQHIHSNQKPTYHMNITIRKTSKHDARVAFEITRPHDSTIPIEAIRIRSIQDTSVSISDGIVLENYHRKYIAVVVNVRPNDIIAIRHKSCCVDMQYPLYFSINESLEPIPMIDPNLLRQIMTIIPSENQLHADDGQMTAHNERDLKLLLQGKHPRWLQDFVNCQLLSWREHNPALYVRVAPRELLDRDVFLVAIHAPYRALVDYEKCLTRVQIEFCVRSLQSEEYLNFFSRIPRKLRSKLLAQHATHLLEKHVQDLTDKELRICSWKDALTAFRIRHSVSPKKSAIMLSSAYTIAWIGIYGTARLELRLEILTSMLEYPKEWLRSNPKGLEFIFSKLKSLLGIQFDDSELHLMLRSMHPKGREDLSKFIAKRI